MRRNVGIAAIKNKEAAVAKYKSKGNQIAETNFAHLVKQFEAFKSHLEEFAVRHKEDIKKNPEFRSQFQSMCATIGVDPLASSKGFWAEMLGVGDFYYHLAIRVVEITMSTSKYNGGLMDLDDLVKKLNSTRSKMETEPIYKDDVIRSIKTIKVLGNGFSLITLSRDRQMVQSVPGELNMDQTNLLKLAQDQNGKIDVKNCSEKLNWSEERSQQALEYLLKEGIAWIDDFRGFSYWIPGLFDVNKK